MKTVIIITCILVCVGVISIDNRLTLIYRKLEELLKSTDNDKGPAN